MAYSEAVIFIETPIFTRRVAACMDDDEYAQLQVFFWQTDRMRARLSKAPGVFESYGGLEAAEESAVVSPNVTF